MRAIIERRALRRAARVEDFGMVAAERFQQMICGQKVEMDFPVSQGSQSPGEFQTGARVLVALADRQVGQHRASRSSMSGVGSMFTEKAVCV